MPYKTLNSDNIVATLERLRDRVSERFPARGLCNVVAELLAIAQQDSAKSSEIAKPYLWVRAGVALVIVAGVIAQLSIFRYVRLGLGDSTNMLDFFQGIEAALNTLIIMGAGVFFLTTVEERIKRRRILEDLHELRSIAHVIDMHQLTKDPTTVLNKALRTKSSPAEEMTGFELTRYLDYCAEMLSLTGKLAALYAQNMRDPVVIQAVNEIEGLTTSISNKVWQKIMIMQRLKPSLLEEAAPAPSPAPIGVV